MPPLNIEEMKRRRLKRDKEENVVRKEEEEEAEKTKEEALKRSNQSAFKRKMLEDGGLKVDGWRLKTPIRAELDKEEEEGEPTDTRPRVHLLQPTNPALALADTKLQCMQIAQEAQNAEDSVAIASLLAQTGSAEEATTLRLSATGGSLEGVMGLEGELTGTVEELAGCRMVKEGAMLKDSARGVDLSKLLLKDTPPHLQETEALAAELEALTRLELGVLLHAEKEMMLKMLRLEDDAHSIQCPSDGGRHMATLARDEIDEAEKKAGERDAERKRLRRCRLRDEWIAAGMLDNERVQERWRAADRQREERRLAVKAVAQRRARLRMSWMKFSRLHVTRTEQAAALRENIVGWAWGRVMEGVSLHIEESVRRRLAAERDARGLLRTQLKLRDESYQQRSRAGAVTRLAKAWRCHMARAKAGKLRKSRALGL